MLLMKNMELIGKFILIASQIRTKECLPAYLVSITQRISWRLNNDGLMSKQVWQQKGQLWHHAALGSQLVF